MMRDTATWTDYAEALAFVGNSLLAPMNQTGTMGIEPTFWEDFPDFGDTHVASALEECKCYAESARQFVADGGDAIQRASVEYTKLFIGPPRPTAAPWETMHRSESADGVVGFGQATFEMRRLLRQSGLEMFNENNQYADHIGIEILYASVLSARIAETDNDAERTQMQDALRAFASGHPLAWMGKLQATVSEVEPHGYIGSLLALGHALLECPFS